MSESIYIDKIMRDFTDKLRNLELNNKQLEGKINKILNKSTSLVVTGSSSVGGAIKTHDALLGILGDGSTHLSTDQVDDIHAKYTTAEAEAVITAELVNGQSIDLAIDALIATHKALASDHHAKYTNAEVEAIITAEIVNGQSIDVAIDALIATHAGAGDPHGDRAFASGLDHDHATPIATHTSGETHTDVQLTSAQVIDMIEAIGVATPVAADWMIFSDAGVLKRALLSGLDENILTALKSYVDGLDHHTATVSGDIDHDATVNFEAGEHLTVGAINHNVLANLNAGTVFKHITATQLAALHTIYVLTKAAVDALAITELGTVTVGNIDAIANYITNTDINWNASIVSQVDAEAGISTTARKWTAERVKQAIAALETGGFIPGVVTAHTDVSNAGSGIIISGAERTGLHTSHSRVTTDVNIVDAVEAVGFATAIAADSMMFADGGTVLKKMILSGLDETILTAIKSYVDGQNHLPNVDNKAWIALQMVASPDPDQWLFNGAPIRYDNISPAVATRLAFMIPKEHVNGSLTLHIDMMKFHMFDASAGGSITDLLFYGGVYDNNTNVLIWRDATDITTEGAKSWTFASDGSPTLGSPDIGTTYDHVVMTFIIWNGTSNQEPEFSIPSIRYWYA